MRAHQYREMIGHKTIGIICKVLLNRTSTLQRDAKLRFGKGKSIICAVLGASLVAVVEARDQQCRAESQNIQSLQALVKELKVQLGQEWALVS